MDAHRNLRKWGGGGGQAQKGPPHREKNLHKGKSNKKDPHKEKK